MQAMEGMQQWTANLGSSEIQSRDLRLPTRQANALSTRPRRLVYVQINLRKIAFLHFLGDETCLSEFSAFVSNVSHETRMFRNISKYPSKLK